MESTSLEKIEERLKALENSILSLEDVEKEDTVLIDALFSFHQSLNTVASRKERVNLIFKRVSELQEYLEPGYAETGSIDVLAQRDYILLIEKDIRKMAYQLEKIDNLSKVLNSEQIRDFRQHTPKVNQLNVAMMDQLKESEDLSSELTALLNKYSELTTLLSQHFVQVDQLITNLELKRIQEKEDD